MEIRAGAGGEDARIFVQQLKDMYLKYCRNHKIKVEVLEDKPAAPGLRMTTLKLTGEISKLVNEGGTHRIQHKTASRRKDRIHTSTASVAVLPAISKREYKIKDSDLKIETMRGTGPGGQHRNTRDTAVRITHLPTKTTAISDTRSQEANRAAARELIEVRVQQLVNQQADSKQQSIRAKQTLTDRAQAIRTYDLIEDNVRGQNKKVSGAKKVLAGRLEKIL